MFKNEIVVSIVIPVYNGELYIERTIKSLLNQTLSNLEIICVNDSSTDNSLEILIRLSSSDGRVKVFTKKNGGKAASAVKFGLQFCTGKYFMYSSQDDLFSSDLLEKGVSSARKHNSDAVVPKMVLYYSDEDLNSAGLNNEWQGKLLTGKEAFRLSLNWTIHGFVLWNMEIIKKVGYFDFNISSDEYTTRMLFYNSNVVSFSDGVFYYRQNNPNAITKKWNLKLTDFADTNLILYNFLKEKHFAKSDLAIVGNNVINELVRSETLFWKNSKQINCRQKAEYRTVMTPLYKKFIAEVSFSKNYSLKFHIKRLFVVNGYALFKLFCRVRSKVAN